MPALVVAVAAVMSHALLASGEEPGALWSIVEAIDRAEPLYFAAFLTLSVAVLLDSHRRTRGLIARRQVKWLPLVEQAEKAIPHPNPSLSGRGAEPILMPGYTHLQRAQPILLAHWWLSHYWSLQRDVERLQDLTKRVSVLPLGSGALAGVPFEIDRVELAKALGFAEVSQNSIDGVSDRDFAAEYLFCATMIGIHLSKLAEQIVLFTTAEFGFFELSDAFSTGSSLMPQKKNTDVFGLTRGKSGTLLGLLTGLLATLKGLPSTYDKDLQEGINVGIGVRTAAMG